jgi:hypothetical protein
MDTYSWRTGDQGPKPGLAVPDSTCIAARKLGGCHHNIAMDGALNPALLDPRLPRVGQSRLPAPAGNNRHSSGWGHHSASRARIIGGLFRIVTLIQSRDGPDRYGALSRFEAMPSRPISQACWKIKRRRV